jgi:hypothetical protein
MILQTGSIIAKQTVVHSVHSVCLPMVVDAKFYCSLSEGQLSIERVQPGAMQTGALCHQNPPTLYKNNIVQKPYRMSSCTITDLNAMQETYFFL